MNVSVDESELLREMKEENPKMAVRKTRLGVTNPEVWYT